MKTNKCLNYRVGSENAPKPVRRMLGILAAAGIVMSTSSAVFAGDATVAPTPQPTPVIDQAPPPSIFHGLLELNISNYYITPRGLITLNKGVVFQPLGLIFANLYNGDGWLNNVGLQGGVWNCAGTQRSVPPGHSNTPYWNEIDFIGGINATVFKDWLLSATYLMFVSPVGAYNPSSNLELAVDYHDHFLNHVTPWGKLSINPYAKMFIELNNTATVGTENSDKSYNFELGLVPKYVFNGYPLKVELPSFVTLPGRTFYTEAGDPGLVTTGVKVTAPLTFMPKQYGGWSVYGGLAYFHMFNQGLIWGNTVLPSQTTNTNPVMFYGGVDIAF